MSLGSNYRDTAPKTIENCDDVEELIIDRDGHIHTKYTSKDEIDRKKTRSRRPYSTPTSGFRANSNMDPEALIGHSLRLQDWLNEKSVKTIQEKADLAAKDTRKMYTAVLDTENTFVKELEEVLDHHEMMNLRKRELLHKKWSEQVYEPIRRQVVGEMNGPKYDELSTRKRALHKEYLEHVNRKGHVFLDTFAPDEYYPLSLQPTRPTILTAETKPLKDPLLTQEKERNVEERIIFRCETGSILNDKDLEAIRLPPLPLVPLGRHGTHCNSWLAMPMGDIESPVRFASRRRMNPNYNDSKINFERWSRMPYSPKIIDEEMPSQKKKAYPKDNHYSATPLSPSAVMTRCVTPPLDGPQTLQVHATA